MATDTLHPGSTYRSDIDGLRAIAVSAVVLYHYGATWIPGGFTGVDVFFVISGFLITTILRADHRAGRYSLIRFYARRIRRIVPALLVVVVASLAVGWSVLFPGEYLALGQSAAYAALGFGNFYFYGHTGYFDRGAEFQPLLHTWSLGVEEQFYLVWPAALWFVLRFVRWYPAIPVLLAGVTTLGAVYAVRELGSDPAAAFYLPHPRAWELALGATVAFLPPMSSRAVANLAGLAGLAIIGWGLLTVRSGTSFPGLNALYPCLGAALLVWPKVHRTPVAAMLSMRPLVAVGLISFSLYLWHWPVLVFYRLFNLEAMPSIAETVAMLVLVAGLSIVSYLYVERPLRRPSISIRPLLAAAACTIVAALSIYATNGAPWRLPQEYAILAEGANDWTPSRPMCHRKDELQLSLDQSCSFGDTTSPPDMAIWGDSHGVEIGEALGNRLSREGRSILMLTYSSCPPGLGFSGSLSLGCEAFNDDAMAYLLANPEIATIYLAAYHEFYNQGDVREDFEEAIERSVARLTAAGRHVVLVSSNPEPGYSLPLGAARLAMSGRLEQARISVDQYRAFSARSTAMIDRIVAAYPGVGRADQAAALCSDEWCPMINAGYPILFDDNHLSRHGAAIAVRDWEIDPQPED